MDGPGRTDAELVDAVRRAGDAGGRDELVARYTGRVWQIVYPLVLNHADADDVTQEALVRILRGLDGYRSEASFSTWVYRVAVNTARNFLRSRNRHGAVLVADDGTVDAADTSRRTPAGDAEVAELDRAIGAAMTRLPPEQRAALSLVAIQGLPEKEAARVAGCTYATMRWRVFRARRRMREMLQKSGVRDFAASCRT